jgi:predicted O-methyltransferase YrrM
MQFRQFIGVLVASLSAGSLLLLGCTTQAQQQQENAQTTTAPATPTETTTASADTSTTTAQREPDVVYVPTPNEVVEQMLAVAKVGKNDVIYDLGSGDGRIVITAAQKFGTRGTGIDIDPERIQEANANAKTAGVTDRVKFLQQDLFQTDISDATVVTLYLLPKLNVKLRPKLFKELKPGTRIVSHDFDMGEWKPEKVLQVKGPSRTHTVYFWTIPEEVPANLKDEAADQG